MGDKKVLILDEFTSASDEEAKDKLLEVIQDLSKSILIIAINHDSRVKELYEYKFELFKGKLKKIVV